VGYQFAGCLSDLRLWSDARSAFDIERFHHVRIGDYRQTYTYRYVGDASLQSSPSGAHPHT
jgi:hypothetical protein